jgi:hypothetical protein
MRDELDRALDKNPDYPPGFDPRELEDGEDESPDGWEDSDRNDE